MDSEGSGSHIAKGDAKRVQNQIDYQGGKAQNFIDRTETDTKRQNQGLENRFNVAADRGSADYGDIMSGFRGFAQTGGFSPTDLQSIRARSISPIRAVYSNAQADLARQKALTGGYMPNFAAANAKMAREQGHLTADASTNAEAAIAEMVQKGKLAGLSGMTSAYGTEPGQAKLYGNMLLTSDGQMIDLTKLQQALSLGLISSQLGRSQVPGNFQQAMGNIGSAFGLGGQIAGALTGLGGGA